MAKQTQKAEAILQERFGKDSLLALATAADNIPYVRTVNAFYEAGSFYVLTHALSGKVQQMARNSHVALAGEWFTAHGLAVNMGWFGAQENQAVAAKMRSVFHAWIDNGHSDLADHSTVILRIDLTDAVLFAGGERFALDFT